MNKVENPYEGQSEEKLSSESKLLVSNEKLQQPPNNLQAEGGKSKKGN